MRAERSLDDIEALARVYDNLGIVHEGDCAGSLCDECGHCLHSIETCDHECSLGSGCGDAVDDDTVVMKRQTLALVAALRAVLDTTEPIQVRSDMKVGWNTLRGQVRNAIDTALDGAS